jgi:molecular chaperone GrpE
VSKQPPKDGADRPLPAEQPATSSSGSERFGGEPAASAAAQGTSSEASRPAETAAENKEIESLRSELEQAKDSALRWQAELDNYRKRSRREIEDERRYANMPLLRDLLPVLDNIHRTIAAAEKTPDVANLLEGVKLVSQQLETLLAKHHCKPIEALGAEFNPHLHEAISQQASDEHPANTVMLVAQSGFQLHDRVVRPSQVIVSKRATP